MTILIFTNTGYHGKLIRYARTIENKLGKRINYDKEHDYHYYTIYGLDDLLDIIDTLGYECILYKSDVDENCYVLEVYDDWRE